MTCRSGRAGWRRGDDANAAHDGAAVGALQGGAGFDGRLLASGRVRFFRLIGAGELSAEFESFASVSSGQEAVVANAMEAVGQNVQQKAADELVRRKAHDPLAAVAAIVFVAERYASDLNRLTNRACFE